MDERYEPRTIDVAKDKGVTIAFSDGHVASFDLMTLRLACPCAACRALRDRGEAAWPRPGSPMPLRIERANLHGAWSSPGTTGTPPGSSRSSRCGGGMRAAVRSGRTPGWAGRPSDL
jgi:prepilin-type processing-associated H-X9-DG protein